jgi:uncharacterized protein
MSVTDSETSPTRAVRTRLSFPSGKDSCAATLFLPQSEGPVPCVILGNTMGATQADRLPDFAERFAQAGFAALIFDYRSFGKSSGLPRQVCSVSGQIADFHAAINFAKQHPAVDANRLGLWGASLAGGHVVSVGASRSDLRAIVSVAPTADCADIALTLSKSLLVRLIWAAHVDLWSMLTRRRPHYVPIVAAPGGLAAMNTPGTLQDYQHMIGEGSVWQNRIAARLFLLFPAYRPIAKASRVKAPLLVGVCEEDTIARPRRALAMAARAPRSEVRRYPASHLSALIDPLFEAVVADQIEFFQRHLALN